MVELINLSDIMRLFSLKSWYENIKMLVFLNKKYG
jgi:hypothetical protein